MPSPVNPDAPLPLPTDITVAAHAATALHADDSDPARIYSLNGSIVDGVDLLGIDDRLVYLTVDKPAFIEAGQDIENLAFRGQNLRDADVTRVIAGRDIVDTALASGVGDAIPSLVLGGPGTFDV